VIMAPVVAAANTDGKVIIRGGAHNLVLDSRISVPHHLLVVLPDIATLRKLIPRGVKLPGLHG